MLAVFRRTPFPCVLNRRFHQPGYIEFRADPDFRGRRLAVSAVLADLAVLLNLAIPARVRRVVAQHVQRILAGVESGLADLGLVRLILAADLILKPTAL
jgi:hypothetical protein